MNSMTNRLPSLIRALLQPQRYAHPAQQVELVETHISWVLLAGDFAYKIKKPVKLPFLDFSTLALRRQRCFDEVRLNRRFSPDIYLAVLGIFESPQGPTFSGEGEPIEYAVRMRRFAETGRLDHVSERGELQPQQLTDLAELLVGFQARAASVPPESKFGTAPFILRQTADNIAELLLQPTPQGVSERLAALRDWTLTQHQQLAGLMQLRHQAGRVREGHGDLHMANLVLIDGRMHMFDCIEFSEELRCIDTVSDLAFAFVDLLAHQQRGLANWLVDEVLSRNGDYEGATLLRFYAVYRALVRAKVAALRAQQGAARELSKYLDYLALAEQIAQPPRARLLITYGPSGCGKTLVSQKILTDSSASWTLRLRSDVERKRLFALAHDQRSGAGLNTGIYSAVANHLTYAHMRTLAAMLLDAGCSVIVDACFLKRVDRDSFRRLAREIGVPFEIIAPMATPTQLRERVQARQALGNDASEATLDVLEQQLNQMEPLGVDEMGDLRFVSTEAPALPVDRVKAPSSSPE